DLEGLGEALRHAGDEVLHERELHAPEGARALGVVRGRDDDVAVRDRVHHLADEIDREGALGPLHRKLAVSDAGGDAGRYGDRLLADAAHQKPSARTSPPTFCSRASASERPPFGVETMVMPRPLRTTGSSLEPL